MRPLYVHEMFDRAASARPEAVAITGAGRELKYGELRAWASSIAQQLVAAGAKPGSIAYVAVESRYATVAAIIAALKAAVVFVPVDLGQPEQRLRQLVEQVPPFCVITEAHLQAAVTARLGVEKTVVIGEVPAGDVEFANVERQPDEMTYVYFTSGSTGKPKAIAGRLKSVDHFIRWEQETFGLDDKTVVSQLTSPLFDAFLRDMFVPLTAGGQLRLMPSRETALEPERLRAWLNESGVHVVHTVPSLFRTLLGTALTASDFPQLRWVLLAGEPLLTSDVKRFYDLFGERIRLVNLYGPSETTMVKLFHVVRPEDASLRSIPVGQAMAGARALVLDESGQPAVEGAIGEIYIRTPYRTLGYYGDEEATRKAFVVNPLSGDETDIVYRTGDLGCLLPDGDIEFLGRRDQQVKIRGIRVELEEIENVILASGAAKEAAVTAVADAFGTPYLCAYVAGLEAGGIDDVRRALEARLPDYLVPKTILALDSVPRTATGKLDRKALPDPEQLRERAQRTLVPPCNPVSACVAAVFGEVLGLDAVGGQESFFQLGGHSLSAMRVVTRLSEALSIDLKLASLFEHPTPDALAAHVLALHGPAVSANAATAASAPAAQPIHPSEREIDQQLADILGSLGGEQVRALAARLPTLNRSQKAQLLERLRARGFAPRPGPSTKIEPQPRGPALRWDVSRYSDERVRSELARALAQASSPKLRALGEDLDALAPAQQRALLRRVLSLGAANAHTAPLSYAQQRCWFFESMTPGTATQNITAAVRASGSLRLALFERCMNEIIQRHEILRTNFALVDGEPRQIIFDCRAITIPEESFAALPPAEREAAAFSAAVAEARRPFDLGSGPLLRLHSFLIAPDDRILVLSMHHIIGDQWSMGLLLEELAHLFTANGDPQGLAPLPVQYADYAQWEAKALTPETLADELVYWKSQLSGVPWVLEVPIDRPRPEVFSNNGASEALFLDDEVRRGITRLAREEGVTTFMVTFAAFNLLLAARTGRDDLIVGTDFASRSRPEVARCIGFFINELALRTSLAGDPDFRTLLARVRRTSIEAYKHQHLPFQWLVEDLRPPRDRGRTPVFQVVFDLHNVPLVLEFEGVTFRPLRLPVRPAKYDLSLFLGEMPTEVMALLEYNTDLYDRSTAQALLSSYHAILAEAVANPGLRMSELIARAELGAEPSRGSWELMRYVD